MTEDIAASGEMVVFSTEGPVQAEVFVLRLCNAEPEMAGPCGPEPWYLEVGHDEDPLEVVVRLSTSLLGAPLIAHSTSWRRARGSVILTFLVVIAEGQAPELTGAPIARTSLARSGASSAPTSILTAQVLEHGLRHLAWLASDDPTVGTTLSDAWKRVLSAYEPEPFQHLG